MTSVPALHVLRRVGALCCAAGVLVLLALPAAQASPEGPRAARAFTLVDPGTLGGAQSFLNLPGLPVTSKGALLGTADTSVADSDYPNFNPFVVGFPDPLTAHAFASRNGHMTDLGALPGNNSSAVFQVNGKGVGAGMSENGTIDPITGWPAEHAVVFKNGKVTDLGTLPGGYESQAIAINDLGLVSGFASNGTEDPFSMFGWGTQARSFVWQDGVMKDIGTLGGPDALVATMNTRGQIAGQSYTDSTPNDTTGTPTTHPFLWERGRMRDLGTLGGTLGFANWMNDSGVVVGISSLAGDETGHPFLWNGKQMLDLGTLDGGDFGAALYVNDPGHATGFSYRSDGTYHAFLWANGRMRDLPPPAGAPCSAGFAINDRDDVVGEASDCQGNNLAPILWHKGIPYDLSTLIAPTDLRLDEPEYISDEGEIVGHGFLPNGDIHEFMLVPNPQAVLTAVAATSKLSAAMTPVGGMGAARTPSRLCDRIPAVARAAVRCSAPAGPGVTGKSSTS